MVLVLPERDGEDIQRLVKAVRRKAGSAGLRVSKTFRAARVPVVGEPWTRPVEFLSVGDAHQLYKRLHREKVLVLTFTTVFVRRDPSRNPVVRREALRLDAFVAHKALFRLVRGDTSVDSALDRFLASSGSVSCTGEDDPRALPLHVFAVDRPWPDLATDSGRTEFGNRYGLPRARTDERGTRWDRAARGAYHGREQLDVAGYRLPTGMHWDVSAGRGSGRLTTSNEVWKLKGRSYVNVHPDAHVLPGRGPKARRVWSAT